MRQHLIIAIGLLLAVLPLHAQYRDDQFKRDAFTQTYADSTQANVRDTSSLFSFKAFFGGLAHKQTTSLKDLTVGSAVFIGGNQIYHKQYWKLPIIYGGMGAGIYGGIHFNQKFQETGEEKFRTWRDLSFAGAGLVWWASLMDGVIQYKGLRNPEPSKSTFYSVLLPGLGQIYNGEAWKIPIYWGLIGGMRTTCSTSAGDGSTTRPPPTKKAWSVPRKAPRPPNTTATPTDASGTTASWASPLPTSCRLWTPTYSPTCSSSR